MPYATIGGRDLRLFYLDLSEEKVDKPPLLFLHGFTLDHRMWLPNAPFFKDHYRVLLLDAKGHGLSDAPESGYSRADRVSDVTEFMDALGLDKAHVIGASMGGSTAIGLALASPERLASITLVDTGAAGYAVSKNISRIDKIAKEKGLEAARRKWIDSTLVWYKADQQHLRELMNTMMMEHSGAVWMDPRRGQYPAESDLERVHAVAVPTMIFVGERDSNFLPLSQKLHERIPGSRRCVYEGVGHMLNLEAPERFNRELKDFLDGVDGAR
jgi:3-oxoadipate enol-lactonase